MNALPDLDFWKQFLGLLFAQVTVAVLLAWAITRRLRGGRTRQWCWRGVFVLAGCWLIAASLGLERRAIRAPGVAPTANRQVVIRNNLPVQVAAAESSMVRPRVDEATPFSNDSTVAEAAARPVWWPAKVWLGVGVLLGLRLAMGQLLIAWCARRQDRCINRALARLVERLAARLGVGNRVLVRIIPELDSPVTHGWWRARIALPAGFESQYGREQQEAILSHELAHVAARDPLWMSVSDLASAALWWHPMIWWARAQLRRATEQAADEASAVVEGGPAALAECLVELAGRLHRPTAAGWLGIQGHGLRSGLSRRVRHLLEWRGDGWRPRPSRRQMTAITLAVMTAMVLGVFAPGWMLPHLQADGPSLLEQVAAAIAPNTSADRAEDRTQPPGQLGPNGQPGPGTMGAPPSLVAQSVPPALETSSITHDEQSVSDDATVLTQPSDPAPLVAEPGSGESLPASVSPEPSERNSAPTEGLESRTYAIEVRRLRQAFEEMSTGESTPTALAVALRQYLTAAGVEFGTTNSLASLGDSGRAWQGPTGRSFLFNELNGRLLIRATADEHALVTDALGLLLPATQQIQIEAKFIEITEPLQMSFDWFLGNQLITPETNAQGTETTVTGIMTDPMFSGLPARAHVAEVRGDELDWSGRSDPDAHRMRVMHSLEHPSARVIDDAQLKLLDEVLKRNAADLMAVPRVTTLSGRQTDISVIQLRTLVVGFKPEAVVKNADAPESLADSGPFRTAAFPFGPVLEVIPIASTDSPTVELDVKFTLTEFLGYDAGSDSEKVQVWDHGRKTRITAPVPKLRVRQMNTHATLPDGQTLFMTGASVDETVKTRDKVPVLGDLPLMGRLFRSEHEGVIQKRLIVLITAMRIDRAGNPVRPVAAAP
jgi:type II secretory pathway component GspD/PulD (secretin)/beta-lactamase regulating signal transducer with metallopeptidase domain